jgi:hypothetical protein
MLKIKISYDSRNKMNPSESNNYQNLTKDEIRKLKKKEINRAYYEAHKLRINLENKYNYHSDQEKKEIRKAQMLAYYHKKKQEERNRQGINVVEVLEDNGFSQIQETPMTFVKSSGV